MASSRFTRLGALLLMAGLSTAARADETRPTDVKNGSGDSARVEPAPGGGDMVTVQPERLHEIFAVASQNGRVVSRCKQPAESNPEADAEP